MKNDRDVENRREPVIQPIRYEDEYVNYDQRGNAGRGGNACQGGRGGNGGAPGAPGRPGRGGSAGQGGRGGNGGAPGAPGRPGRGGSAGQGGRGGKGGAPGAPGGSGRAAAPAGREKKRRKSHPIRTFFITILVCLLLVVIALAGISFVITKKAYSLMSYEEAGDLDKEALTAEGVTNILLIGNDSRLAGEDGRSDAMILVSISKNTGKILTTSILRDVYVEIPGHGSNRLNAAYAFGGPELLMETIEKNFDIPVSRYVLVNFEAFAGVVDAVGGVDLELSAEEIAWVNAYLNEYNELTGREFGYDYLTQTEGGMVHLNGPQSLAYARNRYLGTDFGRTERQRKVMEQIAKKLPGAAFNDLDSLIQALCPNLTTNLTLKECYGLVLRAPFIIRYERQSTGLPLEGTWWDETIDSMAVLGIDFDANKEYLRENLYIEK
ncbi:MAG: LCP family protein [Lachnospiraceae bacterium]|nr:LCP family protein [Lachnospiraceae bacterium]